MKFLSNMKDWRKEWEEECTAAINEMFDNVRADGIYPTSKFFARIDAAADSLAEESKKEGYEEGSTLCKKYREEWIERALQEGREEVIKVAESIKVPSPNTYNIMVTPLGTFYAKLDARSTEEKEVCCENCIDYQSIGSHRGCPCHKEKV